jgi:hypothetical protein
VVRFEDTAAVTKGVDCRLVTFSIPTLEASQDETDEVIGRVDGNDDEDCDDDDMSDDDDGDGMCCPSVSSG